MNLVKLFEAESKEIKSLFLREPMMAEQVLGVYQSNILTNEQMSYFCPVGYILLCRTRLSLLRVGVEAACPT